MRDREKVKSAFKAVTLVDQICRALRDNILSGRFKGGQQLLEDQMKNEYGISRTPLREAFRILEKEGLVEIVPRKGTFVKGITRQDVEEHFPVRAILEGLAARLACSNLQQEDLSKMEDLFQSMENEAQKGDFIEYSKYHFTFHEIVITASRNDTLIALLQNLRLHTLWHRYTYQYYKKDFKKSLESHRQLIELYKEKEPDRGKIENLFRQHIEVGLDSFLSAMDTLEM